nr:MAG TPA: hypothetical protein [Caudoviricetes sp.]
MRGVFLRLSIRSLSVDYDICKNYLHQICIKKRYSCPFL